MSDLALELQAARRRGLDARVAAQVADIIRTYLADEIMSAGTALEAIGDVYEPYRTEYGL